MDGPGRFFLIYTSFPTTRGWSMVREVLRGSPLQSAQFFYASSVLKFQHCCNITTNYSIFYALCFKIFALLKNCSQLLSFNICFQLLYVLAMLLCRIWTCTENSYSISLDTPKFLSFVAFQYQTT
ncbi:hypothetical protein RDI58_007593 [Solanum bulbocastanum]|uniref:Uncharacterized protein n=1 Tax=Solanum bulbocastanum TaxID=147425 RepID=A0AAN8YIS6_SOLBU